MPGQFVLEGGKATVLDDDGESGEEAFQKFVSPVKYVHNIFFEIDGSAEVWCELELGNDHPDHPIRIDEVHFGFNNIGTDESGVHGIDEATTSTTTLDDNRVPLLLESTDGSREEKWHKMYDQLQFLHDDDPYFRGGDPRKELKSNDQIFDYRIGPGTNHQHIYTIPVTFDDPERRVGEGETNHSYCIRNIRKLSDRNNPDAESPVLLPDDELDARLPSPSRFEIEGEDVEDPQRIDTISVWLYWEEGDLCIPKDDISYHFRYAVDCGLEQETFTHIYTHYILPKESILMGRALLMESLSENRIEEFHPPETRWMFKEWEEEYDVRQMSSARMARSKSKSESHVFNSGRIGFPALRARHTALQFVLLILRSWAVQSTFSQISMTDLLSRPVPVADAWPLVILPVAAYLLAKGQGPPPLFPKPLHGFIVPLQRKLLDPVGDAIGRTVDALGGAKAGFVERARRVRGDS